MFIYLFLLFTLLPALELYLIIKVGAVIGALNTITLLILTGVVGAILARVQGLNTFLKIQEQLNKGVLPDQELLDGVFILLGGVLLLTPGFITDCLGLFFLIPLSRKGSKVLARKMMENWIKKGVISTKYESQGPYKVYDDIDIN